jgi:4-amino-4-deoxy-L-arabinose transferase-like glycosyltransferase
VTDGEATDGDVTDGGVVPADDTTDGEVAGSVGRHSASRRSTSPRSAPGPGTRGVALVVGLATVMFYGIMVIWACVTPDFRAPDEPQQVSTTLRLAYVHSYPAPGDARIYVPVKASYEDVGFGGIGLNTIVGLVPLHRPTSTQLTSETMSQLGADLAREKQPLSPYDYDQMTQHPPGYFAIMAVAARVFDVIDKTPHTALLILRLCSALLLAPLPFLTFRIGKSLGATPALAAAASFLPAGLPQLAHIGGAVNNDALTITLGAAVTWLALEFATRRAVRGWAIGLGITMTALLWTKGTALPMLVVVAVAFLLRAKRFGARRTIGDALLTTLCILPGLAWWVANVVRFGSLQPDGYPKSYTDLLPHGHITVAHWLHGFFPGLTRSFFADFGWLEAPPPAVVTAVLTVALLVLIVVGVVRCGPRWATALLAQLSWIVPLIAIMDTSYSASNRIGALQGVQGRYLFVGVAAIAATIGVAVGGRQVSASAEDAAPGSTTFSWVSALLPVLALITAALGLAAGVAHFYVGNGFSGEVGTFSAWSPLRLRVLVPIGVICAAATLAGAWIAVRNPRVRR